MSKDRINNPRADMLMGSMRSMGYSFDAAVADIIDNSISAHCSFVQLFFPNDPLAELAMGFLDDGDGMTSEELFVAMRYGSNSSEAGREEDDLGRFGLGMKSASLSQCRILTAISKKDGKISSYTWDYNYIQHTGGWILQESSEDEIDAIPYIDKLKSLEHGTLVVWRDFDVLSKSSDGQIYSTLLDLRKSLSDSIALIFHRFIKGGLLKIFVDNKQLEPLDPFLENHRINTGRKERSIMLADSNGIEREIKVKAFVLPFATDLSEKDKKLVGGIENLRQKQGFYIYRNKRLIIWGTWFGMKPRSELTKNARIRVDIPNTLDDIWNIDIKKQTASIPRRIQQYLKKTVQDTMESSVNQQTHRGRRDNVNDQIDYIWDRMQGRNNTYYYRINRDSKFFKYISEQLTEKDSELLDMLIDEIEQNLPYQQMYIDKSNEVIKVEETDSRLDDLYQIAISMIELFIKTGNSPEQAIGKIMNGEPFCNYPKLQELLNSYYKNDR